MERLPRLLDLAEDDSGGTQPPRRLLTQHDEIWASLPLDRTADPSLASWTVEALDLTSNEQALDVGCGDGIYTAELASGQATIVGVDPSRVAIERATGAHAQIEFSTTAEDGTLPFADASFDALLCLNVLQHVADTQLLLSELRRVLKKHGRLAIAVPSHGWLKSMLGGPGKFERVHDPLGPVLRHYTARTLGRLLDQFGFEQIRVEKSGGDLRCRALRA